MEKASLKRMKKQAEIWRQDALMAPAAYRLYVYMEIEHIPEEVLEYLNEEAIDSWNEQISFENIEFDIELTIKQVIQGLANRKAMESFLFVPILLADLFVLNKGVSQLEGRYRKLINEYAEMVKFDRPLAEIDAARGLGKLMNDIAKRAKIKLTYDVEEITFKIIEQQGLLDKASYADTPAANVEGLDSIIDKALKDYEKRTGESALKGVEEGVNTEELEKEIETLKEEAKKNAN